MPKVYPKPRSIRAQAFEESNYPAEVEGLRCVEVFVPDADEFMPQLAGLVAMATKRFNYQNKDVARAKAVAELWIEAYNVTEWGSCMNCEEMIDCLTPFFTEVLEKLDSIEAKTDEINTNTTNIYNQQVSNRAKLPEAITADTGNDIYGGALALVNQMHENNLKYYAEAELSAVDNAQEALDIVLGLFPRFSDSTYEEAFALGNAYFENQVIAYEADYEDFELPAACDLYCRIALNANVFDISIWSVWLDNLEILIPDNAAAKVFARYSPLRQTLLNQIAEFFNQEISLAQYFKDLYIAYFAGTQEPVAVPEECECGEEWEHTIDFTAGDGDFDAVSNVALYSSGVGWGVNTPVNSNSIVIQRELPFGNYTSISFEATVAPAYVSAVTLRTDLFPDGSVIAIQSNSPGTAITTLTVDEDNPAVIFVNYSKTSGTTFSGYTGVITSVTFQGLGSNPFV